MQARLKVLHDKANVKQVKLLPVTLIGRSTECNLKIASSQVSRAHCRITLSDDTVYVEDLGSANGTLVDGKLLQAHLPTAIAPGAMLVVGPAEFQVDYVASTSQTLVLSRSAKPVESSVSSTELIIPAALDDIRQSVPNVPSEIAPSKPDPAKDAVAVSAPSAPKIAKLVTRSVAVAPVIASAIPAVAVAKSAASVGARVKPVVAMAIAIPAAAVVATVASAGPVAAPGIAIEPNPFPIAARATEPVEMLFANIGSNATKQVTGEASPFDFGATTTFEASAGTPGEASSVPAAHGKKGNLKSLFSLFGRGAKSSPAEASTASAPESPSIFLPTSDHDVLETGHSETKSPEISFGFEEPAVADSGAQTLSLEQPPATETTAPEEDNGFAQFLNQL